MCFSGSIIQPITWSQDCLGSFCSSTWLECFYSEAGEPVCTWSVNNPCLMTGATTTVHPEVPSPREAAHQRTGRRRLPGPATQRRACASALHSSGYVDRWTFSGRMVNVHAHFCKVNISGNTCFMQVAHAFCTKCYTSFGSHGRDGLCSPLEPDNKCLCILKPKVNSPSI